jgi:hypothetical protein
VEPRIETNMSTTKFSELVKAATMATALQVVCLTAAVLLLATFAAMCFFSKAQSRDDGVKINAQTWLRE